MAAEVGPGVGATRGVPLASERGTDVGEGAAGSPGAAPGVVTAGRTGEADDTVGVAGDATGVDGVDGARAGVATEVDAPAAVTVEGGALGPGEGAGLVHAAVSILMTTRRLVHDRIRCFRNMALRLLLLKICDRANLPDSKSAEIKLYCSIWTDSISTFCWSWG